MNVESRFIIEIDWKLREIVVFEGFSFGIDSPNRECDAMKYQRDFV